MRVLNIINSLSVGGAQRLIRDMVPIMNDKGIETEVLVLRKNNSTFEDELSKLGEYIIFTGIDKIYSPINIHRILKKIDNYDIIHTHLFPSQYWYIIANLINQSKCRSVTTEHNTVNRRRNKFIFRYPEKFIYTKYNKIICISESTEKNLCEWIPSINNKTITIHNGINLDKFKSSYSYQRHELIPGLAADVKLVLMVARMTKQKDYRTLIMAAKLLPDNYHIVIVGDGSDRDELYKLVYQLKLSNRVHFLGIRTDVERIMKSVDIFVLSSNWEGFGLVAIEAMASGLPVVTSDVSGLSQIVRGYGRLFPKGDYEKLASCIIETLSQNHIYSKLSKACFERSKEFTIEKMVDRYIEVYKSLI